MKNLSLLTNKPTLYVQNIGEEDLKKNKKEAVEKNNETIFISAKIESEIAELNQEEAQEYCKELGLEKSGLDQLISASYKLLDLITFFTAGPKEAHAWTVENGAKAPEAAGKIHTDFIKGFIKAEVIKWQDWVGSNGELQAKQKGLMHLEGKEYVVRDGDVIYFKVAN